MGTVTLVAPGSNVSYCSLGRSSIHIALEMRSMYGGKVKGVGFAYRKKASSTAHQKS
jgi:hypothetical protein